MADKSGGSRSHSGRLWMVAPSLILAVALLSLAMPRLGAALASLPGAPALDAIATGRPITEAGLERAIASEMRSLEWSSDPKPHLAIATVAMAMGTGASGDAELLTIAEEHLRRSLALAPSQARALQLLSTVELLQGDVDGAAAALELSYRADPHHPFIAMNRWTTALVLGDKVAPSVRHAADAELAALFRMRGEFVVREALRTGHLDELRGILAGSPQEKNLERLVRRLTPEGS